MAHLLLVRDGRVLPWWQEALFAVLMFFTHALTLAFLAIHLGWRAARQRGLVRGTLRVIGVLLPALVLVAWYSRADHSHGEYTPAQGEGVAGFLLFKAYSVATYGPYQNMVFGSQGDMQRWAWLYALGVGLNGVVCPGDDAAAAGCHAAGRGIAPRLRRDACRRSPALSLSWCCQARMFGVVDIGSRFLAPALMFALVSTEDWRGLRRYGAVLACAAPLMVLYVGYLQSQPAIGREVDYLRRHRSRSAQELAVLAPPLPVPRIGPGCRGRRPRPADRFYHQHPGTPVAWAVSPAASPQAAGPGSSRRWRRSGRRA